MNLSEYDKIWGEAPKTEFKKDGEYAPLPDGKYVAKIEKCMWRDNSYTNEPQLSFMFRIIEGIYTKRTVWKNNDLCMARPKSIEFLRKDLNTLGWDNGNISELKDTSIFLEMEIDIAIVNKQGSNGKTYPNIYINGVRGGSNTKEDSEDSPF